MISICRRLQLLPTTDQFKLLLLPSIATILRLHHLTSQIVEKTTHLRTGLVKLHEASSFVDRLSKQAKEQQSDLLNMRQDADLALIEITKSMVEAAEQKKEMEALTGTLKDEELNIFSRKVAVEKELAEVEPLIRNAKSAVGEIKSEALSEIRSLRAPPPAIRDVLEAVLRLMGNQDMSWNSMKVFLGQRTVKDQLMNFDVRSISKSTRMAVEEIIRQKSNSFEESVIKRASLAAAPLAVWVKANVQYSAVIERVSPLENDLQILSKSLEDSRSRVETLRAGLVALDQNVNSLRLEFSEKTRDAENLKISLEKAIVMMNKAQTLLGKLSGEGDRWKIQLEKLGNSLKELPYTAILCAGYVTYLACAPEQIRITTVEKWKQIMQKSDSFSFISLMSTFSERSIWKSQGLPTDLLSIENAIILNSNDYASLLVDPSGEATNWLTSKLKDQKLDVVSQSDKSFLKSLELAVRFGRTIIVMGVSEIDPVFFPIIRKSLVKQGPRKTIEIGEKTVDYNNDFKLYFVSSEATFKLPCIATGFINVVNFTTTKAGLATQLLGIVIQHEKPELEIQTIELLKKEEELRSTLFGLEEQILVDLAASEGNILENQSLINSLDNTKEKSVSIEASLEISSKMQESLEREREKFEPISTLGSNLYFVLEDLKVLNHMYQFSMKAFLQLYKEALGANTKEESFEDKIMRISNSLQASFYNFVSRALFKNDRHVFALHMISRIFPSRFKSEEWDFFLGKSLAIDPEDFSIPKWIPAQSIPQFKKLMATIPTIRKEMDLGQEMNWLNWLQNPCPELNVPAIHLNEFQKLLLIQTLRPDRMLSAISEFSRHSLRLESSTAPNMTTAHICIHEANAETPVLLITTPGADPSSDVRKIAIQTVGEENYYEISMGQGQENLALQKIKSASSSGGWVALHNIHLVMEWLQYLERELKAMKANPSFRLVLITEEHSKYPSSFLSICCKTVVETPPGLKLKLSRIYDTWTPNLLEVKSASTAKALFSLAWFHSIILERRNYLPQGWTKFYDFSNSDLRSGMELIMKSDGEQDWEALVGVIQNAIYGGRVDDAQDCIKLDTCLRLFFNQGRIPGKSTNNTNPDNYRDLIESLPNVDSAKTIGLPANIDRAYQLIRGEEFFARLNFIQNGFVTASISYRKNEWAIRIIPLLNIWKKLTLSHDFSRHSEVPNVSDIDPLQIFLDYELSIALQLMKKVNFDLIEIEKVCRGNALLNNDTSQLGLALSSGETPSCWQSLWAGSGNPEKYVNAVVSKFRSIKLAMDRWNNGTFFSSSVKLDNFFHPQAFINSLRQYTARKLNRPMDDLVLQSSWDGLSTAAVKFAVEGLLIQGCKFEGVSLLEAESIDPVFSQVPRFELAWLPKSLVDSSRKITLPMYSSNSRENLVSLLQVPLKDESSYATWILAGAAFFVE